MKKKRLHDAIGFHDLCIRVVAFIKDPRILKNGKPNKHFKSTKYIFAASLCSVLSFCVFVQELVPSLTDIDVSSFVNSVHLTIMLSIQAIMFGLILAVVVSVLLYLKERKFHKLIFQQVLLAYSIENFLAVLLIWIVFNRIVITGDIKAAVDIGEMWYGFLIAIAAIYLSVRLLVKPLFFYFREYYPRILSFLLLIVSLVSTSYLSQFTTFGFGNNLIKMDQLCETIYEEKRKSGEFSADLDKWCFIGKCIENFKSHTP